MHNVVQWMKGFLILYLLLTILMQLAAVEEYKKYLRFLSGIILLLVLSSPLLRLLAGDSGLEILKSYDQFWEQLDAVSQETGDMQFLQDGWGRTAYEDAVAADMLSLAQQKGFPVSRVSVSLSETLKINQVTVWLELPHSQKQPLAKEELEDFLTKTYQLELTQIMIYEI